MEGVAACFGEFEDPRSGNAMLHDLLEILLIALATFPCGGGNCVDMADFAKEKEDFLRDFLSLENGPPSHDTFIAVEDAEDVGPVGAGKGFCGKSARHAEKGGEQELSHGRKTGREPRGAVRLTLSSLSAKPTGGVRAGTENGPNRVKISENVSGYSLPTMDLPLTAQAMGAISVGWGVLGEERGL